MNNSFNTPNNSFNNKQRKNKKFNPRLEIIFEQLQKKPSTVYMIWVETSVPPECIGYYLTKLILQGRVKFFKKDFCEISKRKVSYYSIKPEFIIEPLNLF
jgi:hypothetical protein